MIKKHTLKQNTKLRVSLNKSKKYRKGGIRFSKNFHRNFPNINTRSEIINYFIRNSSFKILTNTSISCLTIVAKLNPGISTPFKTMRSNNFELDIRKILIKIMVTNYDLSKSIFITRSGRPLSHNRSGIEIQSMPRFIHEIETQINIYKKSLISNYSLLDPICPAILHFEDTLSDEIYDIIYNNLNENGKYALEFIKKMATDTEFFNPAKIKFLKNKYNDVNIPSENYKISTIIMEYMDDYEIAANINTWHPNYSFLMKTAQYEFMQLNNEFHYFHGDSHFGNFMINPNYPYFYDNHTNRVNKGKIIIIDFGRTIKTTNRYNYNMEIIRKIFLYNGNEITKEEVELYKTYRIDYIKKISGKKILDYFNISTNNNSMINYIWNSSNQIKYQDFPIIKEAIENFQQIVDINTGGRIESHIISPIFKGKLTYSKLKEYSQKPESMSKQGKNDGIFAFVDIYSDIDIDKKIGEIKSRINYDETKVEEEIQIQIENENKKSKRISQRNK